MRGSGIRAGTGSGIALEGFAGRGPQPCPRRRARSVYPIPTDWACCSFLPSLLRAGATMTSHFWKLWIES